MHRWIFSMLAFCACGRIAPEVMDGSADATGDVALDTLQDATTTIVVCPSSSPVGLPCAPPGLQCEYGPYFDPYCNDVVWCDNGTFVDAPPQTDCAAKYEFDAGCPAEPPDGGTSCPALNAACDYAGAHCICTSACVAIKQSWLCIASPPNCPLARPRFGTACDSDGQKCVYGDDCCGGLGVVCVDGMWQRVPQHTCP
jgi:hypothetical protein